MRISKKEIDAVKQSHDLLAVMQARGIKLKKQGKQYMGKCPFHEDKKASMSVDPIKQLFHCFGCDVSGDVLGFLSKIDGKSFPELMRENVAKTNGHAPISLVKPSTTNELNGRSEAPHTPTQIKLLRRVVEFYQGVFPKDPQGQKYLEGRGIVDRNALRDFSVGYANGSLLDALPP